MSTVIREANDGGLVRSCEREAKSIKVKDYFYRTKFYEQKKALLRGLHLISNYKKITTTISHTDSEYSPTQLKTELPELLQHRQI
jgi:hypothetical protein